MLHAAGSFTGADVRRIMAQVIGRRGAPTRIRSDNGSEFVCEALVGWLPQVGANPIPVRRGEPLGRMHISKRFTVDCGTSFWTGSNTSKSRILGRKGSGFVGNTTRSDRTVRWTMRRRKNSARPVTKRRSGLNANDDQL